MKISQKLTSVPTPASLKKWNTWLAILLALQGLTILLLSTTRSFPINASYLAVDSLQSTTSGNTVLVSAVHHLFELNLAHVVAAMFLLPAIVHLCMAIWYRKRYEKGLKVGLNRSRWLAYALSMSVLLIGVALLAGVYDLVSLLFIVGLVATTNLAGLIMEMHHPIKNRKPVSWVSFVVVCVTGALPWLAIGLYLVAANIFGNGHVSAYVYGLYATALLLAACVSVHMYLQFKKRGPWAEYLFVERGYMLLNFLIVTLVGWQIFAGVLKP